jgi:neutral trehalase
MISDKALKEFKKIWKEEYGQEISTEKAVELGINLLTMFDAIYRPIPKSWLKDYEEKENNKKGKGNI